MVSRDYEEFIAALESHGIRYLIIGAHAVAYHARPRATKAVDVLLDPTPDNAERVLGPCGNSLAGGITTACGRSRMTFPTDKRSWWKTS